MKQTRFQNNFDFTARALPLLIVSLLSMSCGKASADCDLNKLKTCCAEGGGDGCPKVASCAFDDFSKIGKNVSQCTATPAGSPALPGIIPQGARLYHPRATGYYPHGSRLEGGFHDRRSVLLHTLQDFLDGDVGWVSVAMDDQNGLPYGTHIRIFELEEKYHRVIDFRVVDTGGAFYDMGFDRMDICTRNETYSLSPDINNTLTMAVLPIPPGDPAPAPTSTPTPKP